MKNSQVPLKGHCTIQLIDDSTGKVIQETQDENMVTNAIQNVLNPPPLMFAESTSSDYENYMFNTMSSLDKLLGGVMLWSETIEENPDTILPPNIDAQVGYAGNNAYTGANAFRGSYNAIESGKTHTGHRFVWDFPSSAANGTIKCVTLTSGLGGRCGWGGETGSDVNRNVGLMANIVGSVAGVNDYYPAGMFLGQWQPDTFTFARVNGKEIVLTDVNLPINGMKTSSDSIYTNKINRNYKDDTHTTITAVGAVNNYPQSWFVDVDKVVICSNSSSDTFHYIKLDPLTKTIIAEQDIKAEGYTFYYHGESIFARYAEIDGFLYVIPYSAVSKLLKINLADTTNIEVISLPTHDQAAQKLFNFNGRLGFRNGVANANRKACYLNNSGEWVEINCNIIDESQTRAGYRPMLGTKPPFTTHVEPNGRATNTSGGYVYSTLYNAYLATINNLQTPIQKTASQSMKVTYTLTDVEQA